MTKIHSTLQALLCLSLLTASCKNSSSEPAPIMSTALVPCMEAAGTMVLGKELAENNVGPEVCSLALRRFLLANPSARIVDVVPIDAVVKYPKLDATKRETKELLVVKADRGPWQLARDLEVGTTICSTSGRGEESPAHCSYALNKALTYVRGASIWIPITFEDDEVFNRRSGTAHILHVYRRPDGVPPSQP